MAFTGNVSRRLWICLQDPGAPGAFGPPVALHVPRKVVSVVSGDLNGDGATDLLAGISRRGVSLVLLRDPRSPATFQRAQRVKARHECRRVGIADLDGDARLDLVCAGDTQVSVFEQRGSRPLKFHRRLVVP